MARRPEGSAEAESGTSSHSPLQPHSLGPGRGEQRIRNTDMAEGLVRREWRDETRTWNQAGGESGDCVWESSRSTGFSGFSVGGVTLAIAVVGRRVRVRMGMGMINRIRISSKRRSRWNWAGALTVAVFGLPGFRSALGRRGWIGATPCAGWRMRQLHGCSSEDRDRERGGGGAAGVAWAPTGR